MSTHYSPGTPYRILALDGGGSWALIQIRALQRLFNDENIRGHRVLRHFDLVVTNSGGSIAAMAMAEDWRLSEIINFYRDNQRRRLVFVELSFREKGPGRRVIQGLTGVGPRYKTAEKLKGLYRVLGQIGQNWLHQVPNLIGEGSPHFLICTFDYDRDRATFFRSDRGSKAQTHVIARGRGHSPTSSFEEVRVAQALHASSNAPLNFFDEPAKMDHDDPRPQKRYWDGAVGGYNNPVMAGLTEALCNEVRLEDLRILSIGTGNDFRPIKSAGLAGVGSALPILCQEPQKQNLGHDIEKMATSILTPCLSSFDCQTPLIPKISHIESPVLVFLNKRKMKNLLIDLNHIAMEAIRFTKPGPPMAARSLAILYTAIYDAWSAYDPVAEPVHRTVPRRPTGEHDENNQKTAIAMAAYQVLKDQFPELKKEFKKKVSSYGLNPNDNSTDATNPVGLGNKAAEDVLDFRHDDHANQSGSYQDTTGYAPSNIPISALFPSTLEEIERPDRWQPLTYLTPEREPATPNFIAPHWGDVKAIALTSGDQFRPPVPQPYTSQGFLDQARLVIDIQANLTPKQKVIAEYWADGPKSELPPGHWTIFTSFVAERDKLDLGQTVKLYFAVANAILDASIATWEAKRFYDYPRPITTMRHLFRDKIIKAWGGPGQGTIEIKGESWLPFQVPTFPTPPFAEYTSGHSAFSMAAATVLKEFTGSN